jgi:hypothetical protein
MVRAAVAMLVRWVDRRGGSGVRVVGSGQRCGVDASAGAACTRQAAAGGCCRECVRLSSFKTCVV